MTFTEYVHKPTPEPAPGQTWELEGFDDEPGFEREGWFHVVKVDGTYVYGFWHHTLAGVIKVRLNDRYHYVGQTEDLV